MIHCPICETSGPFKTVEKLDKYTILYCNLCGLEFTESMQYDPMYYEHFHYADDYNLRSILFLSREDFIKEAAKLLHKDSWQPHNSIFQWIDRNIKKGSIITDIGCGTGWFIAALESKGFMTIGIEVSTRIVKMLKNKDFRVYLGPLNFIKKEFPDVELVVLLGVIEHVDDPVGLLREIRRKFPMAILLVSIPSPKRWDFRLGIRNYWDYPPNHLTPVWSEEAIKIALNKSKFLFADWLFPKPTSEEIWYVCIDWLLTKLNLRRKGYFLGLTNVEIKQGNIFIKIIRLFYPFLNKIAIIIQFCAQPLLKRIALEFRKRGYSGLSAIAIAYPN